MEYWNIGMMEKGTSIFTSMIFQKDVIPAKAGTQANTGFRVKPGMTTPAGLLSACDSYSRIDPLFHHSIIPLFQNYLEG